MSWHWEEYSCCLSQRSDDKHVILCEKTQGNHSHLGGFSCPLASASIYTLYHIIQVDGID